MIEGTLIWQTVRWHCVLRIEGFFWISRAVVSEEICLFLGAVAGRKEASLDENPVNVVFAVDICPGGVGVLC